MSERNWTPEVRELNEQGLFEVSSQRHTGEYYVVDSQEGSCTCPHHKFTGAYCKHLQAVKTQIVKPETLIYTDDPPNFQADMGGAFRFGYLICKRSVHSYDA